MSTTERYQVIIVINNTDFSHVKIGWFLYSVIVSIRAAEKYPKIISGTGF